MPDKPKDGSNPVDTPSVEEQMAELAKMKEDLTAQTAAAEAQQEAARAETERTAGLNRTIEELTNVLRPADPDPVDDLPENVDPDMVRTMGVVVKEALRGYNEQMAPAVARVEAGQFEAEWHRVRASDTKNFGRMEKVMRDHFEKNPHLKVPGAAEELFVRMRGQHYQKLQEMDKADRIGDDPTPTPGGDPVRKGKDDTSKFDTMNSEELGVSRGLGSHPQHYFMTRYGRKPNFEDGYLEKLGFQPLEAE